MDEWLKNLLVMGLLAYCSELSILTFNTHKNVTKLTKTENEN